MRVTRMVVMFGSLVAAAAVIAQASAASPASMSVHCTWHGHIKARSYSADGALVGSVTCDTPLGKGAYHERYHDHITQPQHASETGSSKMSFKTGTVHGTYLLYPTTISGTAPYKGKLHITGGTGQFKHVGGTLRLKCDHTVPGTVHCTATGPLTGV